jgi:2'-5' RNA ligase
MLLFALMRCFIAVELPEEIKREMVRIQEELPEFFGKKTEKENLHLTLKFLGEISETEIERVKRRLSDMKIKKFNSGLGELGVFSPEFIRIIWIHLTGCEKLQEEVDKKLKDLFPVEERFMGHITIARVKNCDKKNLIDSLKLLKVNWREFQVNEFVLKESILTGEKPIYKDIKRFKLE